MELQLSVSIEVTADEKQARLVTSGRLTETNQHILYPLIHRARTLTPQTQVVVDLTAVTHFDAAALDLLRWEVALDQSQHPTKPVQFALLTSPPTS
jgi:anti-anti-sigma regulatory factor